VDVAYIRKVETTPGWVTVLEYHDVAPASPATQGNPYVMTPQALDRQMAEIAAAKKPALTAYQLAVALARHDVPHGSVIITFDDGYEGVYRYAYPVLRKYGFHATCFVIGIDAYVPSVGLGHMTVEQMRKLEAAGWDMESHSFDLHPPDPVDFGNAPAWFVERDLAVENDMLHRIGSPAVAFAYPGGVVTAENMEPVERDYLLAFTSGPVQGEAGSPWAWPRVTADQSSGRK
jgi:peptidoglycan/xylan/chitin deacetylase (PgdA/CDA1 family)